MTAMSGKPIRKVVIAGGGTAGWMAAASLSRFARGRDLSITLIESSGIGTIGVGEATIPSIVRFNHGLGIDELDFIRATGATFKLGIQFEDWRERGHKFFHPFSDYGTPNGGVDFHHYFYRLRKAGRSSGRDLTDYSIACSLATHGNFAQPLLNPPSPLADYAYAYHFDAGRYAEFLRELATGNGVRRLDGKIVEVRLRPGDGFIQSLLLDDGSSLEGDLFIDCTGFRGLLIEEALQTGYEDWSHWLPCDSAVAAQTERVGAPLPYTRTTALDSGWMWRIPLQHRTGSGYVFSSHFLEKEKAQTTLLENLQSPPLHDPRSFHFRAGRRRQVWNKNCFALGLASGFLEPLESTSISLIQTGIAQLLTFFPDRAFDPAMIAEVNRRHRHELENIRDFIVLHYKLNRREDTEFWRHCRAMAIPDSLQHKIDLFRSCGHIAMYQPEAFEESSWLSMYHGFGLDPLRYDARADAISQSELSAHLHRMRDSLEKAGRDAMPHGNFLRRHCL